MGTNKTLNELLPWLERTKRQDLYPTQLLFTDVLPWLQKLPADFDTILDIGCGPGFMSAFFYTRGHKVVACDPWDRFQFKDIIEYHKATAEVFKEKKFDAILLSHVLEHIPDVKTFMDEIKYLLNDNGYLFILLPVSLKVENGHWWQGWSLHSLVCIWRHMVLIVQKEFFNYVAIIPHVVLVDYKKIWNLTLILM